MTQLQENIALAEEAVKYARSIIVKSTTSLESNSLLLSGYVALQKGMNDVRESFYDISPLSVENRNLELFKNINRHSEKFSLGNCGEMSDLVLNYILKEDKKNKIFAESFTIEGGNHTFVVIGRNPRSDPKNPLSWGPHAVICDPWANQAYPASEYLTKLKNWHYSVALNPDGAKSINALEDFNHAKHTLSSVAGFNTSYLREKNSLSRLTKNYHLHLDHLEESLDLFEKKLILLIQGLQKNPSPQSEKELSIIMKKREEIIQMRNNITLHRKSEKRLPKHDYDQVKSQLNQLVKQLHRDNDLVISFTALEARILFGEELKSSQTILLADKIFNLQNPSSKQDYQQQYFSIIREQFEIFETACPTEVSMEMKNTITEALSHIMDDNELYHVKNFDKTYENLKKFIIENVAATPEETNPGKFYRFIQNEQNVLEELIQESPKMRRR